jgi:hypothetical protein
MDQPWGSKREQQPVFIEEIERDEALALALVIRARGIKAERLDWNRECGRLGRSCALVLRRVIGLGFAMTQQRESGG